MLPVEYRAKGSAYTGASFSIGNRLRRALWVLVAWFLFAPSPRFCHSWRAFLLRCFGAKIGVGVHIYPKARIWAPWNLRCGNHVGIGDGAEIYNPCLIDISDWATISQGAFLCGASHDYRSSEFPLIAAPIVIERKAWVAANAFIHMGVIIGEGCVIGAGSVVTRSTPAWSVCAGNPCHVIKKNYKLYGDA